MLWRGKKQINKVHSKTFCNFEEEKVIKIWYDILKFYWEQFCHFGHLVLLFHVMVHQCFFKPSLYQ